MDALKVYSVWIKGLHKEKINQQIICIAKCAEQAIGLTQNIATQYGFSNVEIDQFTCIGDIDIFPWSNEKESEVEKCQS